MDLTEGQRSWVPGSCTLPTQAVPLRVAEFDSVFDWVRAVQRPEPTRLVLIVEPGAGRADLVRDLVARESSCCSFFRFDVAETDHGVVLHVAVPAAQVAVLDAVARRASRAAGSPGGAGPVDVAVRPAPEPP